MRDPIETLMMKARIALLLDFPMFGQIIMHLELQDASDWCPTAATDGQKFYYNREFIKQLTLQELIFLCAHEVLHCVFEHMFHRGKRDPAIWNCSADALINYILVKNNTGKMPANGIYNEHWTDDFTTEQLYDLIYSQAIKVPQPLDLHLDAGDGREGSDRLSPEDIDEIRDTLRSVIVQAAQTEPGSVPLGVQRLLNRLLAPKLDWRQILNRTIRSTIKHDYTYMRPSRRYWNTGLILPGQEVTERIVATVWLDGSASTTQAMVTDFLSECQGIIRTFRDFELTVGTFDTACYNVEVFTPANPHIARYVFRGGGGTAPHCCWDYMKQQRQPPMLVGLFTDGHVGKDWGDPHYAETFFVIHSNPHLQAPYGRTIHYEPRR